MIFIFTLGTLITMNNEKQQAENELPGITTTNKIHHVD